MIQNDPEAVAWLEDNPPKSPGRSYRPHFLKLIYDIPGGDKVEQSMMMLTKHDADKVHGFDGWQKLYD